MFTMNYSSPLGDILLAGDGEGLTGLWFSGQKYFAAGLICPEPGEAPVFQEARRWLDRYFSGGQPGPLPPLRPAGTPFQRAVWELLLEIPYGTTATYGELSRRLSARRGLSPTSPRAVGGAVGHNPISILIPCHRVVGRDGSLTGYAGGVERKRALLELECKGILPVSSV